MTIEHSRLKEARNQNVPWKKWGPYLSERQWGTVREDNSEGNHGEDVKEYYFYLDSTPTHSYMKYLYKYPQAAYPYGDLVETNRRRGREEFEYELLDTGVFDQDRYFDVFMEYAKQGPEDILVQITVFNRGPEAAELHVLPTLWFRNDWASWVAKPSEKPSLSQIEGPAGTRVVAVDHPELGTYYLYCEGDAPLLFTDNETNNARLFPCFPNASPYVKDGINDYVVHGQSDKVNPEQHGTKVAAHYKLKVDAGQCRTIKLCLSNRAPTQYSKQTNIDALPLGQEFDLTLSARLRDADEFYRAVTPPEVSADTANLMRQAIAGMLWSKQFYFFEADNWLEEHHAHPLHKGSRAFRNREWFHMINQDIISMPDKWEYPWYAAWDLAFHTLPLAIVDPDFAKTQMELMLHGRYLHPSGQLPAYEWNFSDVNPPVHAWATLFLHRCELTLSGETDVAFLKSAFNKLLLNFTWWVNRKDRYGRNVFEGGFLGLDNIGVFDRSAPLPTGGYLEQADGTAWMALFTQNMGELAVELAAHDPTYEDMAFKFIEHFIFIASAMNQPGDDGMWDEEDGFYYDLLRLPDGSATRLKVRSMVGLLPLCAVTVVEQWQRERIPNAMTGFLARFQQMPELLESIHPTGPGHFGVAERGIIALVNPDRLRRILTKMLDENEFLSPYGIRSLSKFHAQHPFVFYAGNQEYRVDYLPSESNSGMFGGNSNWRGPVWMPVNAIIIRALLQYYLYYGDSFKIECPTGSGKLMNLFEVAKEIETRLTRIFLRDEQGKRPVYGGTTKFQDDPHWRDHILFYEYFHGDNGAGLGASHQTGWTGLVAKLIQLFGSLDPEQMLAEGKMAGFRADPSNKTNPAASRKKSK